ncbi:MAG: hypothetical protein ACOYOK_14190 [Pseudobdellovibrionaceae bacterium]
MMTQFDWDEEKNKANRKKHGIWFEEAQSVFDDVYGRLKKKGYFMKKEYDFNKMKEIKNPYPAKKKKAVGINLSSAVIDYFKKLSEESGVSYQKLIDLYLLDCVKNKKKLSMKWTA